MVDSNRRAGRRLGPGRRTGALVLAICLRLGGPLEAQSAAALQPVPHPEIAQFETAVRTQLEAQRSALESYLDGGSQQAVEGAELFGQLGRLYQVYDLLEAAAACYRNAHQLTPQDRRWLYLSGVVQEKQSELDAAATSFEQALRLGPGDPPTLVRLAEVELKRQNLEAAAELFAQALDVETTAAAAHHGLGKVTAARRDFAAAAGHFELALALQPGASRIHFSLAQAYRRLGRLEEAAAQLEQQGTVAVAIDDPLMSEVLYASASAAQHAQRAAAAVRAGRLDEAEAEYRLAVERDPENASARLGLAGVLTRRQSFEEAIEQYRQAIRIDPANGGLRANLGLVLKRTGAVDEALEEFRAAVGLAPQDRGFRQHLAQQLAELGRYDKAEPHYRELLGSDTDDVGARIELATVLLQLDRPDEARAMAATVLELDASPRQRAQSLVVTANSYRDSAELERIVAALRQATEIDPSWAPAHFQLANFLGIAGSFAEAASEYRVARELEPDSLPAWLGESTALALAGREAEAIRLLEEGLRAMPRNPALAGRLAALLANPANPELRDGERALELAFLAFDQTPSVELAETIAAAFAATGRFAEAAAWQERLVSSARDGGVDAATVERLEATLESYRSQQTP